MPLQTRLRSVKPLIKIFLLFIFFFLLFLPYRHLKGFLDENDNFLGGMVVASGGDVYSEYPSQHMPLMYYISAIFRVLGASSVYQFRIFSYLFLSALYIVIYVRYSKYFWKRTLIVYFASFIALLVSGDFAGNGHKFLAEQIQSQALVVLFLELILHLRQRKVLFESAINESSLLRATFSWGSILAISLGIFFSVGTAFVSVYSVTFYLIGLVLVETFSWRRQGKNSFQSVVQATYRLSWLFVVIGIPFLLLLTWYYFSKNLSNFYEQAYYLNTAVYSKYIGGLGTDKMGAALNPFYYYMTTFKEKLVSVFSGIISVISQPSEDALKQYFRDINFLICVFFNVTFLTWNFRKSSLSFRLLGTGVVVLFLIQTGTRGFVGFHAMGYWAISLMMGCIFISEVFEVLNLKRLPSRLIQVSAFSFLFFCYFTPYGVVFSRNIRPIPADWGITKPVDPYEDYIEKITTQSEKIYIQNMDHLYLYMNANRLPASHRTAIVPWFADLYEEQVVSDLSLIRPKLIIYDPKATVWGYVNEQFAPAVDRFILQNYALAPMGIPMWVRKDFLPQALEMLKHE
jgi:hypothetical protein